MQINSDEIQGGASPVRYCRIVHVFHEIYRMTPDQYHPLRVFNRLRHLKENRNRQVDLVIIGAQKAGTSWLAGRLDELPYTQKSKPKETHFFRYRWKDKFDAWSDKRVREIYLRKFWAMPRNEVLFEASPGYLPNYETARRMARINPESRLVVVLREPVARAYSMYNMRLRNGKTTASFNEFYSPHLQYAQQKATNLGDGEEFYKSLGQKMPESVLTYGLYYYQLRNWFSVFPREQIHILLTNSLRNENEMRKLLAFLQFEPDDVSHMQLNAISKKRHIGQPINDSDREELQTFFEPYNQKLYRLLKVDSLPWQADSEELN